MSATYRCPNEHDSEWNDFCSSCGAAMNDAPAAAGGAPAAPAAPAPSGPKIACVVCGEANDAGTTFCESCGHDLNAPAPIAPVAPPTLIATVRADRVYFDQHAGDSGLAFPTPPPAPFEVDLDKDSIAIGRRSKSRGIEPDINLGPPFDDPAVSHRHAALNRGPDGSWTIVDVGSTNGTRLDASSDLITPGTARAVRQGTRIFVGAWTCIEISERTT